MNEVNSTTMNNSENITNSTKNSMGDLFTNSDEYLTIAKDYFLQYLPNILGAILIIWIGFKVIKILNRIILKFLKKSRLDPLVESFISSFISIILKILVFLSAAGMLGVETNSFIALLGAAGIAIGMSLSGTLQNFSGGLIIIMFKPYKLGDYIEVGDHSGTVKEIAIFSTILETVDKRTIVIPNSKIIDDAMINYTDQVERVVDLEIGIDYNDDIDLAKSTLRELAEAHKSVIKKDEIKIAVKELGDNAIIMLLRFYVKTPDYWQTKWDMLESIKKTFDQKGLHFPFPQRQVHMTAEK